MASKQAERGLVHRGVFMFRSIVNTLAGILLTSVLMAACTSAPQKTSEQALADKETAEAVQRALSADTHIYTQHVQIEVDHGVVHLSGYVWNDFDQSEAERIAESVAGVTKVVDEMELEREGIDNSPVGR
jgi:hypothetical protein